MEIRTDLIEVAVQFGARVFGALVLLAVAWIVAVTAGRFVQRALERMQLDLTFARFGARLTQWLIVILAALACLSIFDVQTTSFAALIGAAGIALGLAVQGTLSNFASGVMLLVFRPYRVGDVITAAGVTGTVYAIGLFSTTIDSADNRRITVPNGAIFGATIENATYHPTRRVDIAVVTDCSPDIDTVRRLLVEAANETEGALDSPPRQVVLDKLNLSSVEWSVRLWCNTEDYAAVRERALVQIKRKLEQAGVCVPAGS